MAQLDKDIAPLESEVEQVYYATSRIRTEVDDIVDRLLGQGTVTSVKSEEKGNRGIVNQLVEIRQAQAYTEGKLNQLRQVLYGAADDTRSVKQRN